MKTPETLTELPMSAELAAELQQWQDLGLEMWAQFPYEEEELSGNVLPETGIGEA